MRCCAWVRIATTAPTATINTARWRRGRSIDLAARRMWHLAISRDMVNLSARAWRCMRSSTLAALSRRLALCFPTVSSPQLWRLRRDRGGYLDWIGGGGSIIVGARSIAPASKKLPMKKKAIETAKEKLAVHSHSLALRSSSDSKMCFAAPLATCSQAAFQCFSAWFMQRNMAAPKITPRA
jgi:hypothetical protein